MELLELPCPKVGRGQILIQTQASLISAGTERMLVEFSQANLIKKALQQPDKVKQVLDKMKTDGLMPTLEAVFHKLDEPMPLGYCNAGVVLEVAEDVKYLQPGDRVVSNRPHAEVVCVPRNLCAKIPDVVTDEQAAFTVLGAIGLQGVRLAQPALGETFAVIGLGLIGQLTAQILTAHGCRVLGVDIDAAKCALARGFGIETVDLSEGVDPVDGAMDYSNGRGMDGVVITASTKSNAPVHQAARMCRKRGRIVLVGVTGLALERADFYKKEISFQVSCSYGPGRYDTEYEERGHDYPIGYVRWTEQRNFEAILDLMASGKLDVKPLISHRFPFEEATKAYNLIMENKEPHVGIILEYKDNSRHKAQGARPKVEVERTIKLKQSYERSAMSDQLPIVGLIGAGNFTGQVLLPALKKTGVRLKTIASSGGISGTHLGRKFGFEQSTTDVEGIFEDSEINTVFITTRHDTHARFVLQALKAGTNVFVEKPLCLNKQELSQIKNRYHSLMTNNLPREIDENKSGSEFHRGDSQITSNGVPLLMVGFNRRFAPHVVKIKELLGTIREPKCMVMTVNAGMIPKDHWTQDMEVGGGRIAGEVCHFVDLLRFIAGSNIVGGEISRLSNGVGDTVSIQLSFGDGSIGTIHYFANGNRRFPKERLEVFAGQKILQLDNFKILRGHGWKGFRKMKLWRQDKGHAAEVQAFVKAIQTGDTSPITFDEIVETTRVSLELAKAQ